MSDTYWLVYIYKHDDGEYLWAPLGLVEDRETWQNWWEDVMRGDAELPRPYTGDGWWCSDRPVQFGLPDLEGSE